MMYLIERDDTFSMGTAMGFVLVVDRGKRFSSSSTCSKKPIYKGRTINDSGEARAKVGKKTQRLLAQEKKLNSTTRNKKKVQQLVAEEKKFNTNSLPEAPPDH